MKKLIAVLCVLAIVLSMTACAAPQQPQTTQPTATMPAADNTTAPAIPEEPEAEESIVPEEPEAEEPVTPQKPADPPKPAGCQHKNTTFVEDVEPPTCMEYGLLRTYGNFRGLWWEGSCPDCSSNTEDDKSLSLTGCTIIGSDDHVYVAGNPNWVSQVLWLIDQYVEMGFNEWHFIIWYKGGMGCSAGYAPQRA